MVDLNYNESAALTDAHVKKCKLHTEANNCCHAVIHRLEHSKCNPCNIACERPRSISILAGCIQRQKELSQLCSRLKEKWLRFRRNRSFLVTQPMMVAMEAICSQFSTMRWMQKVSTMTLIDRNRAMEDVVVTTTATTTEANKL